MTNSKSTKRALLTSALAMLMCVAMLIGTTFAWFTDTASTAVNKIQAGNLDVELWQADADAKLGADALKWVKAEGHETDEVLWEPGCTYNLESFRIKNNGNLALKYKVIISGIVGDAKLLEAIDFTVKIGDADPVALANWDGTLAKETVTDKITITGTMKTTAGNEYQNLSIDGISITVVATQDTVEYDSKDNQYDKDAVYPTVSNIVKATAIGTVSDAEAATVIKDNVDEKAVVTATIPANTVTANSKVALTVDRTAMTADSVTFDINFTVNGETPANALKNPVTVTADIGKGLKDVVVTHNGEAMDGDDGQDQSYSYNSSTGILTIVTATFSPFKITYKTDFEASVNGIGYATFVEALNAAKEGDTVKLEKDFTDNTKHSAIVYDLTGKTLDLNKYTFSANNFNYVFQGTGGCIKNGKMICLNDGSYALFVGDIGETKSFTVENVEMNGGVNVYNATNVELKNLGAITIQGTNYYAVWAEGGSSVKVISGNYTTGNVALVATSATSGGSIEIIGGKFSAAVLAPTGNNKNITIKGGTFNVDPSGYVTEGYEATESNGIWTVSAKAN